MSNKKSKQKIWLNNAIKYIQNNWTVICLLVSVIIPLAMSVIGSIFPTISMSREFYVSFLFLAGSSLVLVLLEIRSFLKKGAKTFSHYESMNSAQSQIFDELSKHMKMRKKNPVILRIYGMRLSSIHRLLHDFMIHSKKYNLGPRKLEVYIYHCAPEFLSNMKPHNAKDELQARVMEMFKIQSESLINYIKGLKRVSDNQISINIHFRKYFSLPSFWAYEIDREDIFWGYFTWDEEEANWLGPENQCCHFNKHNEPINALTDWIHNQLDGLETWALPYEIENDKKVNTSDKK